MAIGDNDREPGIYIYCPEMHISFGLRTEFASK
jgi:hypothetical protein